MTLLRIIFYFFLLICTCASTYDTPNATICWSDSTNLTWEDFQARPSSGSKHAAVTTVKFSYTFPTSSSLELRNCFVKAKSWVKKDKKLSHLLIHEEYHFHVSEIYARKMRKAMSELKYPSSSNIERIFNKYFDEYTDVQDLYDRETAHSINTKTQIKWQEKIDAELMELRNHKSPIVILKH